MNVLVTASEALRRRRIAADQGLNSKDATRWLKRADRDSLAIFKNLFGCGLLDTGHYDLILNMDLLTSTCETAGREVVGALETETRITQPEVYAL